MAGKVEAPAAGAPQGKPDSHLYRLNQHTPGRDHHHNTTTTTPQRQYNTTAPRGQRHTTAPQRQHNTEITTTAAPRDSTTTTTGGSTMEKNQNPIREQLAHALEQITDEQQLKIILTLVNRIILTGKPY